MEDGVVGVEDTLEGTNAAEQRANPRVLDAAPLECPVSDRDVGRQLDLLVSQPEDLECLAPLLAAIGGSVRHAVSLAQAVGVESAVHHYRERDDGDSGGTVTEHPLGSRVVDDYLLRDMLAR